MKGLFSKALLGALVLSSGLHAGYLDTLKRHPYVCAGVGLLGVSAIADYCMGAFAKPCDEKRTCLEIITTLQQAVRDAYRNKSSAGIKGAAIDAQTTRLAQLCRKFGFTSCFSRFNSFTVETSMRTLVNALDRNVGRNDETEAYRRVTLPTVYENALKSLESLKQEIEQSIKHPVFTKVSRVVRSHWVELLVGSLIAYRLFA